MIQIEGCSEQESKYFWDHEGAAMYVQGRNSIVLTDFGRNILGLLRAASGVTPEAQAVLAVLAVDVPLKIETQTEDDTPWIGYRTLIEAVNGYRRSLASPVDLEALQKTVIAIGRHLSADVIGMRPVNPITLQQYNKAVVALEAASKPKPVSELELLREVAKTLRVGFDNHQLVPIKALIALEAWEERFGDKS
jgi:hypothetical protein